MSYDYPVFKRLSNNDAGASPGHQGGFVIPKDIEEYFPALHRSITDSNPTVDCLIDAELFVGSRFVGRVTTRYQFQTWGGTRSPERRLTANLGPLRDQAEGGDYVLFERDIENPKRSYAQKLVML